MLVFGSHVLRAILAEFFRTGWSISFGRAVADLGSRGRIAVRGRRRWPRGRCRRESVFFRELLRQFSQFRFLNCWINECLSLMSGRADSHSGYRNALIDRTASPKRWGRLKIGCRSGGQMRRGRMRSLRRWSLRLFEVFQPGRAPCAISRDGPESASASYGDASSLRSATVPRCSSA